MRLAPLAAALVLLAPAGAAAQGTQAQEPPPDRCQAAERLAEAQPEIALEQLKKALDSRASQDCAIEQLVALADGGDDGDSPYTRCRAGRALLRQDQLEAAKGQFQKAVDADPPQPCGVSGLVAVSRAEDQKEDDDNDATLDEAREAVVDAIERSWPWLAALALLTLVLLLVRILSPDRIALQASKDDEELAKRVVAAANASGGHGPLPAKLVMGSGGALPATQVADLSKLLGLPGTAAITELMRLAAWLPGTLSRLKVSSAAAGGWAVIQLDLRRTFKVRKVRIALPLGDIDAKKQTEVLGLAGGAWLVAELLRKHEESPIRRDGEDDLTDYHACFRAGANCQSRGELETARACYALMPEGVSFGEAPFAWVGARLNQMMALKGERRWNEMVAFAEAVEACPDRLDGFNKEAMRDLLRRRRYMTAIARVDHFYRLKRDGVSDGELETARSAAEAAVKGLDKEKEAAQGDPPDDADTLALRAAIRMVALCFRIADGGEENIDHVKSELALAGQQPLAPRPMLGAAAYYDAACAVSMLADRLGKEPDKQKDHFEYGFDLLETVVAATPVARLPRVREMALNDDMLDALRESNEARFGKILKQEAKAQPAPAPPTLGEALARLVASFSSPGA